MSLLKERKLFEENRALMKSYPGIWIKKFEIYFII